MPGTPDASSLASWNDGAAKIQILDFVTRVTRQGGPDFVPPAERIAVFDNDGTLWCEQPMQVQAFFLITRVKELAERYETPLPRLAQHTAELSSKADAHFMRMGFTWK